MKTEHTPLNMGENLLSVILVTLNEEKIIKRTLKRLVSNLKKSKIKNEIIVADSGKDKTFEIATRFTNKVYKFSERGVSKARNYAVSKASGDILVFMDADSITTPENFKTLMKAFQSEKTVAAITPVLSYKKNLSFPEKLFYTTDNAFIKSCNILKFLLKFYNRGDFLAVRKDIFSKIGRFNESLNIMEITELLIELSKLGEIKVLKTPVYDSSRRLKRWGVLNSHLIWWKNYLSYYLLKHPQDTTYEVVR